MTKIEQQHKEKQAQEEEDEPYFPSGTGIVRTSTLHDLTTNAKNFGNAVKGIMKKLNDRKASGEPESNDQNSDDEQKLEDGEESSEIEAVAPNVIVETIADANDLELLRDCFKIGLDE